MLMSRYRRNYEGNTFFFTVVTFNRQPVLTGESARKCLRESIEITRRSQPFHIIAFVLLPDHLHAIWQLPDNDADYSSRWQKIKSLFSKSWKKSLDVPSSSRQKRQEQTIWQRRFFEHTCRDETDLNRCVDYIHVNPVKHKLVEKVRDWPWSTFHRYVKSGHYPEDWGKSNLWFGDEFSKYE